MVRVRLDDVVLRNCVDDDSWAYRARCARCRTLFLAATPPALALPAASAGVRVEQWSLPVPSTRRAGGPLREIDATELHIALLRPESDWFDELARGITPDEF